MLVTSPSLSTDIIDFLLAVSAFMYNFYIVPVPDHFLALDTTGLYQIQVQWSNDCDLCFNGA